MLTLLSPAKTLDFETPSVAPSHSQPVLLERSEQLIETLVQQSPHDLQRLMGISDALAELNVERYREWHRPFTPDNAKPAVLAFKGDVYIGLDASQFSAKQFAYAQNHLRILSGLVLGVFGGGCFGRLISCNPTDWKWAPNLKRLKGEISMSFGERASLKPSTKTWLILKPTSW